jgi:large conductance mechanosensitive channel
MASQKTSTSSTVMMDPSKLLDNPERQFYSFVDFLTDSSMIKFGVALVISLQLKQIVTSITDGILTPIMNHILDSNINKFHFKIFDINFQLGDTLNNTLSFLVIMFIIYTFIKVFKIDKKIEEDDKKK